MFEDGCHGNTENIPPHMMAQLQASSSKRPLQQVPVGNSSLNSSSKTPNSFANISQPRSSEKSFDRVNIFFLLVHLPSFCQNGF